MNNFRTQIEQLLGLLSELKSPAEATRLRASFDSKDWRLSAEDVGSLQTMITGALSSGISPAAPDENASVFEPSAAHKDDAFKRELEPELRERENVDLLLPPGIQHYAPFIATLDSRGEKASVALLSRVNDLLSASDYDAFREAVVNLLVGELRFDQIEPIDERPRLSGVQTFRQIERVAEFEDLRILVVEDTYGGPHATAYNPLFQLHRRVVVFAIHPQKRRIRAVVRAVERICQYTTWVGRAAERIPGENLLTIARRFALVRPSGHETGVQLEARWRKVLGQPTPLLRGNWASVPFERDVPGIPWSKLVTSELSSLLQSCELGNGKLHWGLEAVFRNRFPLWMCEGRARLNLIKWQVETRESRSRWALLAERGTRAIGIKLILEVVSEVGVQANFEIQMELPIPDEAGELIVDGTPLQLCFRDKNDHIAAPNGDGTALDEYQDQDQGPDAEETSGGADESPVDLGKSSHDEGGIADWLDSERTTDHGTHVFSFCELYEFLVESRFALLAQCLWKAPDIPTTSAQFLQSTRLVRGRMRPFSLISLSRLWRFVRTNPTLDEIHHPMVLSGRTSVPSWACIESWNPEDPDVWTPFAGARLHPAGGLAVPSRAENRECFTLQSSDLVVRHGRLAGTTNDLNACWWLSEALAFFSHSDAGAIEWKRHHVVRSFRMRGVAVHGQRLRLVISTSYRSELKREKLSSFRYQDIPEPVGEGGSLPPQLLVQEGAIVAPSAAWLKVPRRGWRTERGKRPAPLLEQIKKKLREPEVEPESHFELHTGPDEFGVVTSCSVAPLVGPSGAVVGWRSAIALVAPARHWIGGLPDGRLLKVEVLPDEDMPFDLSGDRVDLCVFDPKANDESGTLLFDGESGEFLAEGTTCEVLLGPLPRRLEPCPPDAWLKYRLLDGEGIPADGSAPQLSDAYRNWLSSAYPECARLCDAAELRANAEVAPHLPRLRELAEDVGLLPPGATPDAGTHFDPTMKRLGAPKGTLDSNPNGYFDFRCHCGEAVGASRAGLLCAQCGTRVQRQPNDRSSRPSCRVSLPEPVIHPWQKSAAAAWAGLLVEELDQLLEEVTAEHYLSYLLQLSDPFEKASIRLDSGSLDEARVVRLREGLLALARAIRQLPSLESAEKFFLLDRICEPRGSRDLTGQPAGAAMLEGPTILVKLRQLSAAVECSGLLWENEATRPLARKVVQQATAALVGERESPPGWSSFSAAIARQLPLHRSGKNHHVVPGLFRASRELIDDKRFAYFGHAESLAETPYLIEPPLALILDRELAILPEMVWSGPRDSIKALQKHLAFQRLTREYLRPIAALAMASSHLEERWEPPYLQGQGVETITQSFLRDIWHCLGASDADPHGFLKLLQTSEYRELPADWEDTERQLDADLLEWFPGNDDRTLFVRTTLVRVLSGFHRPKGTTRALAQWTGTRIHLNSRFLPPLCSGMWLVLPGVDLVLAPLDWLRQTTLGESATPLERQLLRWGKYPLVPAYVPVEVEAHQGLADAPEPHPSKKSVEMIVSQPELPASPNDDEAATPGAQLSEPPLNEVTVYLGSIAEWIMNQ